VTVDLRGRPAGVYRVVIAGRGRRVVRAFRTCARGARSRSVDLV
jgi:hypothetical protein